MKSDTGTARYGLWVVLAGFVAILIALWFIVGRFTTAVDVTAVLGTVTTAVAGLGGAYFGMNLGQQGKAQADQARDDAEKKKDAAQRRADLYRGQLSAEVVQKVNDQLAAEEAI